MKRIVKYLVLILVVFTCREVLAKGVYKADKVNISINNINDNIENIELYYFKGYSNKKNKVSYENLELIKTFSASKIINNKFKFSILKKDMKDTSKDILTGVDDSHKIDGYLVRFYKNGRNTRDVICGNSSLGSHRVKPLFTTKIINVNYQDNSIKLGQAFNINKDNLLADIFEIPFVQFISYLLLVVLIPFLVQVFIAYIMKFNNFNKFVKTNVIDQLLFHLILFIMYLFFNSLIINTDIIFMLFFGIYILFMIFGEYKVLSKNNLQKYNKKVLLYVIISNVIRTIPVCLLALFIKY